MAYNLPSYKITLLPLLWKCQYYKYNKHFNIDRKSPLFNVTKIRLLGTNDLCPHPCLFTHLIRQPILFWVQSLSIWYITVSFDFKFLFLHLSEIFCYFQRLFVQTSPHWWLWSGQILPTAQVCWWHIHRELHQYYWCRF